MRLTRLLLKVPGFRSGSRWRAAVTILWSAFCFIGVVVGVATLSWSLAVGYAGIWLVPLLAAWGIAKTAESTYFGRSRRHPLASSPATSESAYHLAPPPPPPPSSEKSSAARKDTAPQERIPVKVGVAPTYEVPANRQLLDRVCTSYPYPVARATRVYANAEHDVRLRFEAGLNIGENLIITLAVVGLSWCRDAEFQPEGARQWTRSLGQGGVPLGIWLAAARDAATTGRRQVNPVWGLTEALEPEHKRHRLAESLDLIVSVRNRWAHDGVVRSDVELRRRLAELEPALAKALELSSFLSDFTLAFVQRSSRQRPSKRFSNHGMLLMGDNSVFRPAEFHTDESLMEDSIYLRDATGQMLDLTPFLIVHECPTCGNLEMFYPNRLTSAASVMMKSTDTPHEFRDEALAQELMIFSTRAGEPPGADPH
jgi:hypothetical protein